MTSHISITNTQAENKDAFTGETKGRKTAW
jgi:hypothetical protein